MSPYRMEIFSLFNNVCATRSHYQLLVGAAACLAHVYVLFGDPYAASKGVILGSFDPVHVTICVGTIDDHFNPQTTPQNSTTKHHDTFVQL